MYIVLVHYFMLQLMFSFMRKREKKISQKKILLRIKIVKKAWICLIVFYLKTSLDITAANCVLSGTSIRPGQPEYLYSLAQV
jgi:hypothetical protein